ncbi:MAG TPA: hypothetical protein VG099_22380, partial [Gemmataceae bacterium]|nr:hypothetical protein [Gemmataceae bacterium]
RIQRARSADDYESPFRVARVPGQAASKIKHAPTCPQLLEDAVRGVSANEPKGNSSRDERPADPKNAEAPQAVAPKKKARRLKKKP